MERDALFDELDFVDHFSSMTKSEVATPFSDTSEASTEASKGSGEGSKVLSAFETQLTSRISFIELLRFK